MHFSNKEYEFLIRNYPVYGKMYCCEKLNRGEASIRYFAHKNKLKINKDSAFFKEFQERAAKSKVGKKRPNHSDLMKDYAKDGRFPILTNRTDIQNLNLSIKRKEWYKNNEHPRGMLNKTHSNENKKLISIHSKTMWNDKNSKVNSETHKQLRSDRMKEMQKNGILRNCYSRGKQGTYNINGKDIFFRSLWEANYALYLDFLIKQKNIIRWEFEKETFWFEKIKRGVRSYKPDFKLFLNNGNIEYHEVKGWMDDKSKTKLNRMRIYYPDIKIVLIEKKQYNELLKKLNGIISFFK